MSQSQHFDNIFRELQKYTKNLIPTFRVDQERVNASRWAILQVAQKYILSYLIFFHFLGILSSSSTLDSGISLASGITIDPSQNFSHHDFGTFLHQSRHCGYFKKKFFQNFSKINKRSPMLISESRVLQTISNKCSLCVYSFFLKIQACAHNFSSISSIFSRIVNTKYCSA